MERTTFAREWLTTGEVANQLGYSIPWVRKQITEGRLKARRHPNAQRDSYRVHRDDLKIFIDRSFKG